MGEGVESSLLALLRARRQQEQKHENQLVGCFDGSTHKDYHVEDDEKKLDLGCILKFEPT